MAKAPITQMTCPHCSVTFSVPLLSSEARAQFATLVRRRQLTFAAFTLDLLARRDRLGRPNLFSILLATKKSPLAHKDVVAVVRHVTLTPGLCWSCQTPIDDPSHSECPSCHAINLDW